mgnify:CR=1 FL=1
MTVEADRRSSARLPVPSLRRRLACTLYEGVILFGVVIMATYLYSGLTQQRHALDGRHGLQAFLFLILGIYFAWFWSHGRQTVAMKTWHIRLERAGGGPVSQRRALARYCLSWLWLLPVIAVWALGLHELKAISIAMVASMLGYPLLAFLHPQRQYWHDAACGTRLVQWKP